MKVTRIVWQHLKLLVPSVMLIDTLLQSNFIEPQAASSSHVIVAAVASRQTT